jgi:hypothetical protein
MSEVWSAWDFRDQSSLAAGRSMAGYTVVGTDGEIGRVVEATIDAGRSSFVVETSSGRGEERIMLPAGLVEAIDDAEERIYVDRTRAEVLDAPQLTADADDPKYRDRLAEHYGGYYWTAPSDAVSHDARREATEPE